MKRRLNLPRRTARRLLSLGSVYFETGDQAKAEATIAQALELFKQADDRTGIAEALGFHARMLHAAGETDRALQSFERALPLLRETRNRAAEALVLTKWAEVEIDRGAIDAALPRLDEALRLSRLIASPNSEASALYLRALSARRS